MLDMNLEPWIVGDISTIGFCEELLESQIDDVIDYIRSNYGSCLRVDQMDSALDLFDVDYEILPQYLKDRLDTFNVE